MNENKSKEEMYKEEAIKAREEYDFMKDSILVKNSFCSGYIAGRKAGEENIPKVIQCPYCEHEASNQVAFDINADNVKLKAEIEKLKDLISRAKDFIPSGHDTDCIFYHLRNEDCKCGIDEWEKEAKEALGE